MNNIWVMTITTYKNQLMESVLFSSLLAFADLHTANVYICAYAGETESEEELEYDLRDETGISATLWRGGLLCFVFDVVPLRVATGIHNPQSPFVTQVGANPCFFEYVFT